VINEANNAPSVIQTAGPSEAFLLLYGGWMKSPLRIEKRITSTMNAIKVATAINPENRVAKTAPVLLHVAIRVNPNVMTAMNAAV
jgi:hypothetical protein